MGAAVSEELLVTGLANRNGPAAPDNRVLVIGASTDYIAFIDRQYAGRIVFVTDPAERGRGHEVPPDQQSELLVALEEPGTVLEQICCHLKRHNLQAIGITCFDCESLHLTSLLADVLKLPYPSLTAVLTCRSKFLSKKRWQSAGIDCPAIRQIRCPEEAVQFMQQHGGRMMLKPLTGSGSELIYLCTTVQETAAAFTEMTGQLAEKPATERMYDPYKVDGTLVDPRREFIAEEYCEGEEYSCDFIIEADTVDIIRISRKWLKPDQAPGTVMAYQIPEYPMIDRPALREKLRIAALALGIDRGLCMVDFLKAGDRFIILELTPRPGGDCLPPLLRATYGLDILGLALDVAQGEPRLPKEPHSSHTVVGLRLFAPLPGGIIKTINTEKLGRDSRVMELKLVQKPGGLVVHPPASYHSRILGYALFKPFSAATAEQESRELMGTLTVTYCDEETI